MAMEFFDVFIDDFFGFLPNPDSGQSIEVDGADIPNQPPDEIVPILEPVITVDDNRPTSLAYRVAIPPTYTAGNDVTMRIFFHRTARSAPNWCFIFEMAARWLGG